MFCLEHFYFSLLSFLIIFIKIKFLEDNFSAPLILSSLYIFAYGSHVSGHCTSCIERLRTVRFSVYRFSDSGCLWKITFLKRVEFTSKSIFISKIYIFCERLELLYLCIGEVRSNFCKNTLTNQLIVLLLNCSSLFNLLIEFR